MAHANGGDHRDKVAGVHQRNQAGVDGFDFAHLADVDGFFAIVGLEETSCARG